MSLAVAKMRGSFSVQGTVVVGPLIYGFVFRRRSNMSPFFSKDEGA